MNLTVYELKETVIQTFYKDMIIWILQGRLIIHVYSFKDSSNLTKVRPAYAIAVWL